MRRKLSSWWLSLIGRGRRWQEPGAALFQGLRVRLTLWYCGVLGAALLLFGIALYVGAQYFLLTPIEYDVAQHTQEHVVQWLRDSPLRACSFGPPFGRGFGPPELAVCFDRNGTLLLGETTTELPPAFLSNSVALAALQQGQAASDIVDGGDGLGQTYRYAIVVHDPANGEPLGIVVTGESVQVQENVLSLLLLLLLSIGGVALLGAGLGGLFLANRALVPARLAWTNQQRFIADAAHELRTPLTLLRADAEVLLRHRNLLAADDATLLEDIVAETSHMTTLANNMLTLARLDSRPSHQEHEVVNLTEIVRAAMRRIQALADQKNIALQENADESIVVIGDPTLLEQAILALLDNAIKYNRQGGSVTLRTMVKENQVLLEVQDTGVGIAVEHLPHLGERFYRVDKARSREVGGTGLGLSIAQRIVAAHGGRLSLSSTLGQGTVVSLTLPLALASMHDHDRELPKSVMPPQEQVM
ncbi:MAG TPA: ATP-binding protein [Ktedonosporobacter sp.]|jgi:signal transduction histidine kinase|nr:ATP-binding protein [Ktedonosporobacter sp.]